jgi:hypothetical protein
VLLWSKIACSPELGCDKRIWLITSLERTLPFLEAFCRGDRSRACLFIVSRHRQVQFSCQWAQSGGRGNLRINAAGRCSVATRGVAPSLALVGQARNWGDLYSRSPGVGFNHVRDANQTAAFSCILLYRNAGRKVAIPTIIGL